MFAKHTPSDYLKPLPGVEQKTLVWGKNTLMAEFRLACGSVLPRHSHPHEQTGYLVSGHLRLYLADEAQEVRPGDSWCVPEGAEHGADALEDSVAVEVFSPVREDYIPCVILPSCLQFDKREG
jgi:quercetin dioxygenase-like cupin family protein